MNDEGDESLYFVVQSNATRDVEHYIHHVKSTDNSLFMFMIDSSDKALFVSRPINS